jgi:hypothetical protein
MSSAADYTGFASSIDATRPAPRAAGCKPAEARSGIISIAGCRCAASSSVVQYHCGPWRTVGVVHSRRPVSLAGSASSVGGIRAANAVRHGVDSEHGVASFCNGKHSL